MKLLILSFFSFASFIIIDGRGSAFGYCQSNNFEYCKRDVVSSAKRQAYIDAETRCRMNNGQIDAFSDICTDSCYPAFPPSPGDLNPVYVSCQVNCNYRCEINSQQ